MKEYTKSDITNKVYCPEDCVRLVNMRQVAIYALNGVEILDFYASRDYKTGDPIMVAIVDNMGHGLGEPLTIEVSIC